MTCQIEEIKNSYSVPNLERSFRILEYLGTSRDGMNLTELTKATGYPNNSVFRICRTLEELGYVNRDQVRKTYRISKRIINLVLGAISPGRNIVEIVTPYLQQLATETGETACFGTISESRGVVLQVIDGTEPFRFHVELGMSFDLHSSAPGKAMLASMPFEDCKKIVDQMKFPKKTEHTITKREAFLEHLNTVEEQGYGLDEEEDIIGQRCVSISFKSINQQSVSALWITGPTFRLTTQAIQKAVELLKKIKIDIQQDLEIE